MTVTDFSYTATTTSECSRADDVRCPAQCTTMRLTLVCHGVLLIHSSVTVGRGCTCSWSATRKVNCLILKSVATGSHHNVAPYFTGRLTAILLVSGETPNTRQKLQQVRPVGCPARPTLTGYSRHVCLITGRDVMTYCWSGRSWQWEAGGRPAGPAVLEVQIIIPCYALLQLETVCRTQLQRKRFEMETQLNVSK